MAMTVSRTVLVAPASAQVETRYTSVLAGRKVYQTLRERSPKAQLGRTGSLLVVASVISTGTVK